MIRRGTATELNLTLEQPLPPGRTEPVALVAGCNATSLTWPNGTPTAAVATAISPAEALIAI